MNPHSAAAAGRELLVQHLPGGVVWLILNRPDRHNALSRPVLDELGKAVSAVQRDPELRCVLLRGAGERYFAAGGDLFDLDSVRSEAAVRAMSDEACAALNTIRHCTVPVIACLNGDAIGGGAELAMAADMRLISAHARIGYIQGRLAITSAWGGGPDLFRVAGSSRALRMMARCEMIDAERALQWGIADGILSDGTDGDDLASFLKPLLAVSPRVLRGIKAQAIACRQGGDWLACRNVEREHLMATWLHDDHWQAAARIMSKGVQ